MTTDHDSHRSVYSGRPGEGPAPVFRAEAPSAFDWPEGAVMAVVFRKEDFPGFSWDNYYEGKESFVEFYGSDGWPCDLPAERKGTLSDIIKTEFQVDPNAWRTWKEHTWQHASAHPELWPRVRAQQTLIVGSGLMDMLPDPDLPEDD